MTITDNLLSKSIESMTLAIELYNKPLIKYRTESVVILIINSWENSLKALINKKKWAKIYDRKKDESKPLIDCLDCVKNNLGNSYSNDWYASTKLLYQERCKVIHYYKGLEIMDYMLIQANIILFKNFIEKFFNKSIIKDKSWYILPVATELPYTEFDFVKNTSALSKASPEIKDYLKKVVDIHTNQLGTSKNRGVLINVKVSLENLARIKGADLVVGVDKNSEQKISLDKGVRLSDEGRGVQIEEVSVVLKKYRYHYKDVFNAAREIEGYSQKKFNKFMEEIRNDKEIAFNWGTFSNLFPMKISDKYTYEESIIEKYKVFLTPNLKLEQNGTN